MKPFGQQHILTETALLFGIVALAWLTMTKGPFHDPWGFVVYFALSGLIGAFLGGIFRHFWLGALVAVVSNLALMGIMYTNVE